MSQAALLRFLDLLKLELGADDARAEVGGRDPDRPELLWTKLDHGWRLVVTFAAPPEDRAGQQAKLERLVEGFSTTVEAGELPLPPTPPADSQFRRIDAALDALRTRTGAVGVVIVDVQSPVLWGSADPRLHSDEAETLTDVGTAIARARRAGLELDALLGLSAPALGARLRELGIEPERDTVLDGMLASGDGSGLRHHLLTCMAVAHARRDAGSHPKPRWAHHENQFGYFVRSMANIYLLVTAFGGAFSELHVESTVVHALPGIEQLLLSLPPLDPPPKGARVLRFPK